MPLAKGSSRATISNNIREMVDSGHSRRQAVAAALHTADQVNRAAGGIIPETPRPKAPRLHTGPIHSVVAGRTDHLPMHVPSGSYVLPADIVSGMGEGNTANGFKVAARLFGGQPYGRGKTPYGGGLPGKAAGGAVPIVAAGGEHVLAPHEVAHIGDGDLAAGHALLDDFVNKFRAATIKTMRKLPPPSKN